MPINNIVAQIDAEIANLKRARSLLAAAGLSVAAPKAKQGRRKKKRNLTPEGRARIAEAVKRRWASQRAAK